jgi:hypothetical protein
MLDAVIREYNAWGISVADHMVRGDLVATPGTITADVFHRFQ